MNLSLTLNHPYRSQLNPHAAVFTFTTGSFETGEFEVSEFCVKEKGFLSRMCSRLCDPKVSVGVGSRLVQCPRFEL